MDNFWKGALVGSLSAAAFGAGYFVGRRRPALPAPRADDRPPEIFAYIEGDLGHLYAARVGTARGQRARKQGRPDQWFLDAPLLEDLKDAAAKYYVMPDSSSIRLSFATPAGSAAATAVLVRNDKIRMPRQIGDLFHVKEGAGVVVNVVNDLVEEGFAEVVNVHVVGS